MHLGERECSIQRRHQKIVEEAPSPALDDGLRARMGAAAVARGARRSATSAPAPSSSCSAPTGSFYFLEMNTRLQVEHPVTEVVTGLDLRARSRSASPRGEPLAGSRRDLPLRRPRHRGAAVRRGRGRRLPADDRHRRNLDPPDLARPPGRCRRRDWHQVGIPYDPMLAKIIAHAPTRREAADQLARALEATRLQGVTHNRDFLVATLRTPEFLRGRDLLNFIAGCSRSRCDRSMTPNCMAPQSPQRCMVAAVASAAGVTIPGGFRNSVMPPETIRIRLQGRS